MRKVIAVLGMVAVLGSAWAFGSRAMQESAGEGEWPPANARQTELGYNGGLTCALKTKDWEGAVQWYQEVLGFQMQYKMDDMQWAELFSPVHGVTVGIGGGLEADTTPAGNATLVFGVKDIDKARAGLEAKGVKFEGEVEVIPELVKLSNFKDPAGNELMLFQSLQTP